MELEKPIQMTPQYIWTAAVRYCKEKVHIREKESEEEESIGGKSENEEIYLPTRRGRSNIEAPDVTYDFNIDNMFEFQQDMRKSELVQGNA